MHLHQSTDDVKTMTKFEQIEQKIRVALTEQTDETDEISNKQFSTLEENAKKHLASFR